MAINVRNHELQEITKFIKTYQKTNLSTGLYLCGVPGSGKTYTLNHALLEIDHVYLNCNAYKQKSRIYSSILTHLKCHRLPKKSTKKIKFDINLNHRLNKYDSFNTLINHFNTCTSHHIIVLDEIDLLKTKDQSILYNIFSLPTYTNISILLITISNSFNLDLDSKILSRQGNKKLLFKPYKNDQIYNILNKDNKQDKLTKSRKEFISRRVAAVSGDARKAIRLYESTSKLSIEQISRRMNEFENMLPKFYISSLSMYHKIFLMRYFNNSSLVDAYDGYNGFCTMKKIRNLDFLEFLLMIAFLVSTGIILVVREKIKYIFIREEIESYLKNDKILELFI